MNAPVKTEDLITINAIESVLADSPMGMTVAEIADDVGASSLKVKDALRFLHERGKLVLIPAKRPADNRYQLLTLPGDTDSEGGETDISRNETGNAYLTPEMQYLAPEDYELPDPDPALLASANRMLSERLAGVAHVLRGSGLPGLAEIDDGEDLQPHVAALAGAYQMACADLNRALLEVVTIRNNYSVQVQEGEDLRQQLEALQRESMKGATLLSGQDRYTPAGYVMIASKRKPRRTMGAEKAIAAATSAVKGGAQRADVFALVPIGRAVKGAEWKPL